MNSALQFSGALALSAGILLSLIAAALAAARGHSRWKREGDRILPTPNAGPGSALALIVHGLPDRKLRRLFSAGLSLLIVGAALLGIAA